MQNLVSESKDPSSPTGMASDRPGRPPQSALQNQQHNSQQMAPSNSRPSTLGSSHSYSRSSPAAGPDQKYTPFSTNADTSNYSNTSGSRYYPQTPTGAPSQSPLALADIRSQMDLGMSGDLTSPNPYMDATSRLVQTNSSYLAPWPTYAFDWCKWAVPTGGGAGKMAICSHLEDPHNFVSKIAQPSHSPKGS